MRNEVVSTTHCRIDVGFIEVSVFDYLVHSFFEIGVGQIILILHAVIALAALIVAFNLKAVS